MKWAVGTIAAPRPVKGGLSVTIKSLRANGWDRSFVFAEPGTEDPDDIGYARVDRPHSLTTPRRDFEEGPDGRLGNFQNYLQAAEDLLATNPAAEAILITEDDVEFATGVKTWIEKRLWQIPECGCYSLYTANIPSHRNYHAKEIVSPTTPIVGSLALVWRPHALEILLHSPAIRKFGGSAKQMLRGCSPWERSAVDTFLGQELRKTGYHMRLFTRSLVRHWLPPGARDNSSLQNGPSTGRRSEYSWVGPNPDLDAIFARKR